MKNLFSINASGVPTVKAKKVIIEGNRGPFDGLPGVTPELESQAHIRSSRRSLQSDPAS